MTKESKSANQGKDLKEAAEDQKGKTLIFCFDGTGNEPEDADNHFADESISNVLKLYISSKIAQDVAKGKSATREQRSFYYQGIGTKGFPGWQMICQAFGLERKKILENAQQDLQDHYKKGDTVAVFGFSRGAAIARLFAAQIGNRGIGAENVTVQFLGVFDTVFAMAKAQSMICGLVGMAAGLVAWALFCTGILIGFVMVIVGGALLFYLAQKIAETRIKKGDDIPFFGNPFKDRKVASNVEKAVHLVSLDETRCMFVPTLFESDDRVEEIWFSGVHADIGGSYWRDGLSDIAYEFMVKRAESVLGTNIQFYSFDTEGIAQLTEEGMESMNYQLRKEGLLPNDPKESLTKDDLEMRPLPNAPMHEHKRSGLFKALTLALRILPQQEDSYPLLHWSVSTRYRNVPGYRPPCLRGKKYRLLKESSDGSKVIMDKNRNARIFHGLEGMKDIKKT